MVATGVSGVSKKMKPSVFAVYICILYACVHSAHGFVVFTLKSFKYAMKPKESDAIFYAFLCFRYLVPG